MWMYLAVTLFISLIGVYLAWKKLISDKKSAKEQIRQGLINTGISEYHQKGQAKTYLLQEFEHCRKQGWTEQEFEEIYETIGKRTKGRKFKEALFALKAEKNGN